MNSRERLKTALNHRQPDRVCVDFGGTYVSGIHASIVHQLKQRLIGPNAAPTRVHEPYQMPAQVDEELRMAIGADVIGVWPRKNIFGYEVGGWKPFALFDGTPVQVPANFNVTPAPDDGWHTYPEGDMSVPPSGHMPKGGYFFDTIIRQEPLDEDNLSPGDNLEEFGLLNEADLAYYRARRGRDERQRTVGQGRHAQTRRHPHAESPRVCAQRQGVAENFRQGPRLVRQPRRNPGDEEMNRLFPGLDGHDKSQRRQKLIGRVPDKSLSRSERTTMAAQSSPHAPREVLPRRSRVRRLLSWPSRLGMLAVLFFHPVVSWSNQGLKILAAEGGGIFPRGNKLAFMGYSGDPGRDLTNGFTVAGPVYGNQMPYLQRCFSNGWPVVAHVGPHITFDDKKADKYKVNEATLRAEVEKQMQELAPHKEIVWWAVTPEELRPLRKDEMKYLDIVCDVVRKHDPLRRPISMA